MTSPAPPLQQSNPIRISSQILRNLPRYALGTLLLGAYQFLQWWFDTRLTRAIDAAVVGARVTAATYGAWLAGVAVLAFGVRVASRLVMFNAGRMAEYQLRRTLLARLHRLGPVFFAKMSAGEIMSRATNDLTQIRLLLGFCALNLVNTVFGLVSALSVTLGISVRLTFTSLATIPLLVIATFRFARLSYLRNRESQAALGQLSEVVQSSLVGIRVIKTHSMEPAEQERFARIDETYLERSLSLARLRGSMGPIMQAITSVSIVVVIWYGGQLMLRGELSPGELLAFLRALARLTWPLMALGFLVGIVQRGRASYARLLELYDAEPDIKDGSKPVPEHPIGHISVRGLSYAYGPCRVLNDVSFELVPGRSLAIVGPTGSGKSTLAALLARVLPAPPETVYIDGTDVCDLPIAYARGVIGYARQSAFLFSTTAARNVGFCFDQPEGEEQRSAIERAALEAQVLDELNELPDGLETVVGERGVQLSGGQKQRVALARALAYKPRVLLLDDPLSAVDSRTEKAILDVLEAQKQDRSVILITHRVAAAARCNHVIVLDEGRVVESGSHSELLARGGLYRHFADEQRRTSQMAELSSAPLLPRGGSA